MDEKMHRPRQHGNDHTRANHEHHGQWNAAWHHPEHRDPDRSVFLPVSRADMDARGWDQCDFVFVSSDAYVDHPSFACAIITRVLGSHGYKVGVIAQPDWRDPASVTVLGEPAWRFSRAVATWARWSTTTPSPSTVAPRTSTPPAARWACAPTTRT